MISPVNFANIYHNQINNKPQNNKQIKLNCLNQPNCDSVCFTGAARILTDICDKSFVNILTKELKLNEEAANNLRNTIWKYLRENKIQSLSDIGGEEHFDEQVKLQQKITKVLKISEDDDLSNEYIADELIRRCDDGKDYIPLGLNGHARDDMYLEKVIGGDIRPLEGFKNILENSADDSFYKYAKKLLRQTPEESYEFRKTVEEYLKENNLKSISELFNDEDLIGHQAELIEKLEKKFDLNENQSTALNWEFLQRASLDSVSSNYKPMTNPHISDLASIRKIFAQDEYTEIDECFEGELFRKMSIEAVKNDYENVFEIFAQQNNPSKSESYKFITQSNLTPDQKINLIIDLTKVAQDPEEFAMDIPKQAAKDNFYASIKIDMISEKLTEYFKLADTQTDLYDEIISKKMKDIIRKTFPKHITGGENISIKQATYEIAEEYKLPTGAEKEIEKIIKDIDNGDERLLDSYIIDKLKSDN